MIPFMTTSEILVQLERFGFYIIYDEESSLPDDVLTLLMRVGSLGFDKITIARVQKRDSRGRQVTQPAVLAFKSEFSDDLMTYGITLSERKLNEKLRYNYVMDLSWEKVNWGWLTATLTIDQILEDNADIEHYWEQDVNAGLHPFIPIGPNGPEPPEPDPDDTLPDSDLTPYTDPDDEPSEESLDDQSE